VSRGDDVIRASEIGQYAFCTRAWWYLRVKGYPSANVDALQRGTARHARHGRAVVGYHRLRRVALFLLALAALALLAWLLLSLGR
jgi:3-mercaptopyruvate sulfurtransferase SseA